MNRRSFLGAVGATLTLSASAGCTGLDVGVPERTPIGDLPDSIDDASWNDIGRSEEEYLFEGTAVETEYGHPVVGDGTGVVAATDFSSKEGLYPEPLERVDAVARGRPVHVERPGRPRSRRAGATGHADNLRFEPGVPLLLAPPRLRGAVLL